MLLKQSKPLYSYGEENTSLETIGTQGSILGPLIFLNFVNNLQYATNMLKLIADNTSFFPRTIT